MPLPAFVGGAPVAVRVGSHAQIVGPMWAPGTPKVTGPPATGTGPPSHTPGYVNRGGGGLTGGRMGTVVGVRTKGLASIIEVFGVGCASERPVVQTVGSELGRTWGMSLHYLYDSTV